ncbi:T9SS type A sorting domain-containing protein [Olleya sp. R77988]|uniref:DUF7619 domain-containing protein n=1 Tax=Olleya sp. R77988 TaxID=3093875 RepID=UPI0037C6A220
MNQKLLFLFTFFISIIGYSQDDPSFYVTPNCEGGTSVVTGTPGGTFTFNPIPTDAVTIDATSGTVTNGISGVTYTIEYTTNGNQPASSTQNLTVLDAPIANTPPDLFLCDGTGNGIGVFDLQVQDYSVLGNQDPNNFYVSYYITQADADANTNPLSSPFTNTVNPQLIFAVVEDISGVCSSNITTFNLFVDAVAINQPSPLEMIDDNIPDGFTAFDLTTKDNEITGGNPDYTVSYHETQTDAYSNTNALTSPYTNIANPQTVYVRVEDLVSGCYSTVTLDLVVNPQNASFQVNPATLESCNDNNATGNIMFDLTIANPDILGNLNPNDYSIVYYEIYDDALLQTNPIANATAYNYSPNIPIVYAGVTEIATGNYVMTTIDLLLIDPPIANFDLDSSICDGETIILNPNLDPNFVYQWNTGENTATITTNIGGIYTVDIIDTTTGCQSTSSIEVFSYDTPILSTPNDITICANEVISLTDQTINIVQNTPANYTYQIIFYTTQSDADNDTNPITNSTNYIATQNETIYVRVLPTQTDCYSTTSFNITVEDCSITPTPVTCGTSVNTTFCYDNNDTTQFTFESTDGSPLQVVFNSGLTENNYDEVIILDSDGVTDLNLQTPYGNSGDLTGLTYVSSGSTITIGVTSDGSVIGCTSSPWDFDITCVNTTAVPSCTSLSTPLNGATNVNENIDLIWNNATGVVVGYRLTILTATGLIVVDDLDLGNVSTYTPATLDSDTMYFVTITPYNTNGDAVGCMEESFTTRSIPSPPVGVNCGAEPSAYIFTEDFETDTPSGWTGTMFGGSNGEWDVTAGDTNSSGTGPFASFSGNSHLEYEASGNSSTIATAISPAIDLTNALTTAELSFYMHAFGADIGTLNIGVSNSATGNYTNIFSWAGEYQATDTEAWLPVGVNLDAFLGQVIYIEISYGASGTGFEGDLAIDLLRVQTCGSFCVAPSNITVVNITDTTADVSWTANGTETSWEYIIQPVGTGTPTTAGILTNTNPVVVTGLNYNTAYEVCVRADCGVDGFSNWTCLDSFTTLPQTNFTVDCTTNQPVNVTYCYENSDTTLFTYTSNDGLPLTMVFNAGQVENNFDELIVYDSDGSTNLNTTTPYGNSGDVSGLTFTSTGDSISFTVASDGSIGCSSNNYTSLDVDVFCASTVSFIEVNAFLDLNNDGVFNGNDTPFSNGFFTYEVNDDTIINTVNSTTGSFTIFNNDDANTYDITFAVTPGYESCYSIPTSLFENINATAGNTTVVDIPIVEVVQCEDVAVYLVPSISPVPGFLYWNNVVIENLGATTVTSGSVEFVHDAAVNFVEVWNPPATGTITLTATGFIYDFVNLQPGQTITMYADMTVPATVALGTMLTNSVSYTTVANDIVSTNNSASVTQEVVGSYDPNDITESYGPEIVYDDFITTNEYLYYTIRFQNLGTAEAINIRIENTLDALLDNATIQMIDSSHDVVMHRLNNQLTWTFDNINLPAEVQDERGSHGYVVYKIKPLAGYNVGTVIPNTAEIYFDFNAAVITNTFTTTFVAPQLSVAEFGINGFSLYPNPANAEVNIRFSNALRGSFALTVIDIQGKQVFSTTVNTDTIQAFNVSNLESGMYFVKLKNSNIEHIQKLIVK